MWWASRHGFTKYFPVDIMDEYDEIRIPVKDQTHIKYDIVGGHMANYEFMIALNHFKGHPMGGYGGALKNIEKNDDEESIGAWETTLATKMMMKLLELWLTQNSRKRIEKMLEFYHPLDRAAMAYALVVYVMTGTKMTFKSAVATQHYKTICKMLKEDMPQLMFANHMKYMVRRYGPKKREVKSEK